MPGTVLSSSATVWNLHNVVATSPFRIDRCDGPVIMSPGDYVTMRRSKQDFIARLPFPCLQSKRSSSAARGGIKFSETVLHPLRLLRAPHTAREAPDMHILSTWSLILFLSYVLGKSVIVPGAVWYDTDGNEIQAHGAGILKVC